MSSLLKLIRATHTRTGYDLRSLSSVSKTFDWRELSRLRTPGEKHKRPRSAHVTKSTSASSSGVHRQPRPSQTYAQVRCITAPLCVERFSKARLNSESASAAKRTSPLPTPTPPSARASWSRKRPQGSASSRVRSRPTALLKSDIAKAAGVAGRQRKSSSAVRHDRFNSFVEIEPLCDFERTEYKIVPEMPSSSSYAERSRDGLEFLERNLWTAFDVPKRPRPPANRAMRFKDSKKDIMTLLPKQTQSIDSQPLKQHSTALSLDGVLPAAKPRLLTDTSALTALDLTTRVAKAEARKMFRELEEFASMQPPKLRHQKLPDKKSSVFMHNSKSGKKTVLCSGLNRVTPITPVTPATPIVRKTPLSQKCVREKPLKDIKLKSGEEKALEDTIHKIVDKKTQEEANKHRRDEKVIGDVKLKRLEEKIYEEAKLKRDEKILRDAKIKRLEEKILADAKYKREKEKIIEDLKYVLINRIKRKGEFISKPRTPILSRDGKVVLRKEPASDRHAVSKFTSKIKNEDFITKLEQRLKNAKVDLLQPIMPTAYNKAQMKFEDMLLIENHRMKMYLNKLDARANSK